MIVLHAPSQPPQPWKNGGGVTRELFTDRPGDAWRLRISLADITRDGPFSPFAGVQRWFTVVQGAGVRLSFAGGERPMTPSTPPLGFDGADAPGCQLIAGATRDLNLMLRGVAGGMAAVLPGQPWVQRAAVRALFSVQPAQLHIAGQAWAVDAMSLLLDTSADAAPWTVHGNGPAWWLWADLPPDEAPR